MARVLGAKNVCVAFDVFARSQVIGVVRMVAHSFFLWAAAYLVAGACNDRPV